MSDREKLIELLSDNEEYSCPYCDVFTGCTRCKYEKEVDCFPGRVADHLISNGVTVGVDTKPLKQYLTQIDEYAGLKLKFLVFKADTGERIENCFVLRPDKDAAAVEALRAYANATDNETLAEDIYNWVGNGVTVQNWIPVSERLPEYKKDVLVIQSNSDRSMAVWSLFRSAISNILYWEDEVGNGRVLEAVTHWMPLPEPTRECE